MYICTDCGAVVGTPATSVEDTGEQFGVCPICRGDLVDAKYCVRCHEWHPEDKVENHLCERCRIKVEKMFEDVVDSFAPEERAHLNEIYDGREF